jgi:hypothetical protein
MIKSKPILSEMLLLVALLLAAVAYWAPWVGHSSAGLKLSGQDLGEFVKFIPVVSPTFPRQLFYVPSLACSLCLVLLAANRGATEGGDGTSGSTRAGGYPRWLRVGMLACALLLLPGLLPPAWGHPKELLVPEFRLQGLAVIAGLVVLLSHGLLGRIPKPVARVIVVVLATLALVLPQAAFWVIRARLWAVYDTPTIHLGWGLWLHMVAWLGTIVGAWRSGSPQAAQ